MENDAGTEPVSRVNEPNPVGQTFRETEGGGGGRSSHSLPRLREEREAGNIARSGVGISLRCLATGRTLAGPPANPRCRLKSPTMGEEGGGRSCGTTRELQKLKQQAMEYYRENDVPRRLEELLNSTFYLQPADVYGHLVGTWDKNPLLSSPSPHAPRCGNAVRLRHRVAHARRRRGVGDCSCAEPRP